MRSNYTGVVMVADNSALNNADIGAGGKLHARMNPSTRPSLRPLCFFYRKFTRQNFRLLTLIMCIGRDGDGRQERKENALRFV